jgi:DNA repair protein SbcC/Rad50
MLLKSIKIENIRSYLSQSLDFSSGSTLLSGDIGSGKSTILLAIEFALFGVRRKSLSGSSLLRHGAKQGSVELGFKLGEQEIVIKRFLKRGAKDIKQDAGYIIKNGVKKEGTPVELKSDIIDMLGYPRDMVSKSRDLVYRYTVYTPQEEMKQILFEDKEVRLDTLRKVFNIDKYKRIRNNCDIYLKDLRGDINLLSGKIADIEIKNKQKQQYILQIDDVKNKINGLEPKILEIKDKIKIDREFISRVEADIKVFEDFKKELHVKEVELKNILDSRVKNKREVEELQISVEKLKKEISIQVQENVLEIIKAKENQVPELENRLKEFTRIISQSELIINQSNATKQKILTLDECPTCQQSVLEEHKNKIKEVEDNKIGKAEADVKIGKEQESIINKQLTMIKKELEELRKKESEIKIIQLKKENLNEKLKRVELLTENTEEIKQKVGKINVEKMALSKKIQEIGDIDKEYNELRLSLDKLNNEEKQFEIQKAELIKEQKTISEIVIRLDDELKEKIKDKEELEKKKELKRWLEELFVKLISTMEKHVMAQIHTEFSELFQKWFSVLIEDENISVRLDDEFTAIIEQNGYETAVENLSGGEKTAVALSYRLSLNKVINDVISNIKTKDLIILDEPTDGFSTEQLDKIRDVLEELDMKQVIMVSHENKIESFVDNVIRLNKNEHISGII